ncbi:MAG: HEAT repeat domain-containing protein [Acidimicrobiales bacterium]
MISSRWGVTPRQSVEDECRRRGTKNVVASCVEILSGGDVDEEMLLALGGPSATPVIEGGEGGLAGYWPRVWAMRGLLYAWRVSAIPVVVAGVHDESWRVREMAARVVGRHQLDEATEEIIALRDDEVPRVREAAERALIRLMESGSSED